MNVLQFQGSLILGVHAQQGLQYLLCVSVSVTQHLTFHEIIRATNDTTFSAADEGRNFKRFSLKMLRYEARAFPVGTAT